MQDYKDSEAPVRNSLTNPANWDPTRHQWFAQTQDYKDAEAPVRNSLTNPANWDPVRHQWFSQRY